MGCAGLFNICINRINRIVFQKLNDILPKLNRNTHSSSERYVLLCFHKKHNIYYVDNVNGLFNYQVNR